MQKVFEDIVERLEKGIEHSLTMHDWQGQSAFECAIEIVNQVAQTYEQEVCEWVEKSVDSIKLVREPHRLRLFHIEEDRQYCPYCGKKIKVVE